MRRTGKGKEGGKVIEIGGTGMVIYLCPRSTWET